MTKFFNTDLSQQQFLQQYWQKKPLLIRQAFPGFISPISPDDLAGLACEPEIESRLIEEHGHDDEAWRVTCGPLTEHDFTRLPETHWTMLVQDVDKHLPELQYLLDPFRFIPDWRRDDLMISYAPEFGSVGPHTDSYDVFLLQAMGERRWQIIDEPIHAAKLINGIELQILEEFSPDQEWQLQPGDMLYLPPHIAHHGVALNDCMTFSIGFRAPSRVDMLDALVNTMLEQGIGKEFYTDPELLATVQSGEIDADSVARIKKMLHQAIDSAEPVLANAIGKLVTETKPVLQDLAIEAGSDLLTIERLNTYFELGRILQRNQYFRFAWANNAKGGQLFVAGEAYTVTREGVNNLSMLAENATLSAENWQVIMQDDSSAHLLCQLVAEGAWFWQEIE
ncbi:MAG: cupin domain-containing protein [Methyloprofundus sp.]|nr:cupin domain-containing protein [Methyloprofundus sp.]